MIKLIVGIGNPDEIYLNTRHNVGFMLVDFIAKKNKCDSFKFDKAINTDIVKCKLEKNSVILAKPRSYVNNSGEVIKKICQKSKVKIHSLVVMQDDLDIPFGKTKLSFDRNSGGHRGIDSIMKSLKTKKFYRLRIGLSTRSLIKAKRESPKKRDEFVRKFVLSKFSKKESEDLKSIFKSAYDKLLMCR
jgi:peptidyl-tRNA hydrolase, PTH1 family